MEVPSAEELAEAVKRIVENPQLHAAICETQRVLGAIIHRPALTSRMLSRPPISFMYAVFESVREATGFGEGLFDWSTAPTTRGEKIRFLVKLVACVSAALDDREIEIRAVPNRMVSGTDALGANILLQSLAKAATSKHATGAVKKTLEKGETKLYGSAIAIRRTLSKFQAITRGRRERSKCDRLQQVDEALLAKEQRAETRAYNRFDEQKDTSRSLSSKVARSQHDNRSSFLTEKKDTITSFLETNDAPQRPRADAPVQRPRSSKQRRDCFSPERSAYSPEQSLSYPRERSASPEKKRTQQQQPPRQTSLVSSFSSSSKQQQQQQALILSQQQQQSRPKTPRELSPRRGSRPGTARESADAESRAAMAAEAARVMLEQRQKADQLKAECHGRLNRVRAAEEHVRVQQSLLDAQYAEVLRREERAKKMTQRAQRQLKNVKLHRERELRQQRDLQRKIDETQEQLQQKKEALKAKEKALTATTTTMTTTTTPLPKTTTTSPSLPRATPLATGVDDEKKHDLKANRSQESLSESPSKASLAAKRASAEYETATRRRAQEKKKKISAQTKKDKKDPTPAPPQEDLRRAYEALGGRAGVFGRYLKEHLAGDDERKKDDHGDDDDSRGHPEDDDYGDDFEDDNDNNNIDNDNNNNEDLRNLLPLPEKAAEKPEDVASARASSKKQESRTPLPPATSRKKGGTNQEREADADSIQSAPPLAHFDNGKDARNIRAKADQSDSLPRAQEALASHKAAMLSFAMEQLGGMGVSTTTKKKRSPSPPAPKRKNPNPGAARAKLSAPASKLPTQPARSRRILAKSDTPARTQKNTKADEGAWLAKFDKDFDRSMRELHKVR